MNTLALPMVLLSPFFGLGGALLMSLVPRHKRPMTAGLVALRLLGAAMMAAGLLMTLQLVA